MYPCQAPSLMHYLKWSHCHWFCSWDFEKLTNPKSNLGPIYPVPMRGKWCHWTTQSKMIMNENNDLSKVDETCMNYFSLNGNRFIPRPIESLTTTLSLFSKLSMVKHILISMGFWGRGRERKRMTWPTWNLFFINFYFLFINSFIFRIWY